MTFTTDDLDNPREGYYLAPAVKDGPLVGQRIDYGPDEDGSEAEVMRLHVAHEAPITDWPTILSRWPYMMDKAVSKELYDYALDNIAWHQHHDPSDPHARPFEAVDFGMGDNMAPADAIVAAEKLVETAKAVHAEKGHEFSNSFEDPYVPSADIADRAINAVKMIRVRKDSLDQTIKDAHKAAKAVADAECAEHFRMADELEKWQAAMQAIAHEARSAASENIKTMLGVVASQRETVAVEVVDKNAVPHQFVQTVKVVNEAAILELAKQAYKTGEPLPEVDGVRISVVKSTVVK